MTTLTSVDFPEPLGPINAWIVPLSIARLTPESAASPPNVSVRSVTSRSDVPGSAMCLGAGTHDRARPTGAGGCSQRSKRRHAAAKQPDEALGRHDHHHDHERGQERRLPLAEAIAHALAADVDAESEREREGADDRPRERSEPADDRVDHELERLADDRSAVDHPHLQRGLRGEHAGERHHAGRQRERRHLVPDRSARPTRRPRARLLGSPCTRVPTGCARGSTPCRGTRAACRPRSSRGRRDSGSGSSRR